MPELDQLLDPTDFEEDLAAATGDGAVDLEDEDIDTDMEDLDDEVHDEFDAADEKAQKVRAIVAEEMAKRDQRSDAEKMIDRFNAGATDTEKMLVDAFLDADRGVKQTKSDIDRLKAKAKALDDATQARLDAQAAERIDQQAGMFRAPAEAPPFRPTKEDEQKADFKKVATNASDAKQAANRMLKRDLEGWSALEPKLR